jgi:hypothetical protein
MSSERRNKTNAWRIFQCSNSAGNACPDSLQFKKKQHVELLLRHGPHKMQVSEYLTKLPDKKLLEERLAIYSKLVSQ